MERRITRLLQIKVYELHVDEYQYIIFESKHHYKNIDKLENYLNDLVYYGLIDKKYFEEDEFYSRFTKIKKFLESLSSMEVIEYDTRFKIVKEGRGSDYCFPIKKYFPTIHFFLFSHFLDEELSKRALFFRKMRKSNFNQNLKKINYLVKDLIELNRFI